MQEMPNAVWKNIFMTVDGQLETIKHPETVKEVKWRHSIIIVMLCPDVLHCSSYYYP